MLNLNENLLIFGGVAGFLWLVTRMMQQRYIDNIFASGGDTIVQTGKKYATLSLLQSVAKVAFITIAAVVIVSFGLQAWIASQQGQVEALNSLVEVRNGMEVLIDSIKATSTGVWIFSILVLTLIWLSIARSGSSKKWQDALEARRKAIGRSLEGKSLDDLKQLVGGEDSEAWQQLQQKLQALEQANVSKLAAALQTPAVEISGNEFSVLDLEQLLYQLEDPQTEHEDEEAAKAFAEQIRSIVNDLHNSVLSFQKLDGTEFEMTVGEANVKGALDASEDELQDQLATDYVEQKLSQHEEHDLKGKRSEPELLKEWVGAAATSEMTVAGSQSSGRWAARIFVVALILGSIGFSTGQTLPDLIAQTQSLELSLLDEKYDQSIATDSYTYPEQDEQSSDLASDEETAAFVATAFQTHMANNYLRSISDAAARKRVRRSAFQLAAVQAKQDVLSASSRVASERLDRGASAQAYNFDHSNSVTTSDLDNSVDRRVQQLKKNERLWNRLRREAAKPASRQMVEKAMFRGALADNPIADRHLSRSFANSSTGEFFEGVARSGSAYGQVDTGPVFNESQMTARERRLVADYKSQIPGNMESRVAGYQSGRINPGSLNRVSLSRASASGGRAAAYYDNLFPASDKYASNSGGTSSKGSGRSYKRVRFNAKVGGVVIGRLPEDSDVELDLVDIKWNSSAQDVAITLVDSQGVEHAIGRFNPAIVHYALAYAADGRVVTTTLPQPQSGDDDSGLEIDARRVVVHPAFEDTTFACRAIQIDRFVDSFLYSDEYSSSKTQQIQAVRSGVTSAGVLLEYLGRASYSTERQEVVDYLIENAGIDIFDRVKFVSESCGYSDECFPFALYESFGFQYGGFPEFTQCLAENDSRQCINDTLIYGGDISNGLSVDSGVREAEFTLDPNLSFLTGAGLQTNDTWPLDFIVQAVPTQVKEGDMNIKEDWDPWEFPVFANQLRSLVEIGISSDSTAQGILSDMKQFTILQRLFRTALNGDLGFEFPLNKLSALQQQTSEYVVVRRHERWNMNESIQRVLNASEMSFQESLRALTEDESADTTCRSMARGALEDTSEYGWPYNSAVFELVSDVESICSVNNSNVTDIVNLRNRLRAEELIDEAIYFSQQLIRQQMFPSDGNFACPTL